jgi:hemolysin D
VTAAQAVMVVVPQDDTLEVEAQILNKDVGFIRAGQEAEVKFETFLFTRYGTIRGRVESVSSDAVTDPKLGLVYPVRVALPRTTVGAGEAGLAIAPGMSATVEIKTDTRKVIDYVLSPLMRYRKESLRER